MSIKNIFSDAVSKSKKAYNDLDKGKSISLNMRSDRFTYDNKDDNEYDKNWTPKTEKELETHSPEGYFTNKERAENKEKLISGIYNSALNIAKKENPNASDAELENKAKDEANKQFDEEYTEKQISIPSTAIRNIKYNPKTELLQVKFTSGNTTYDYPGVPLEEVQGLIKANSKGEYFMNNIHSQYSIFGKDHSIKSDKQRKSIKKYIRNYVKNNKDNWKNTSKKSANIKNRG